MRSMKYFSAVLVICPNNLAAGPEEGMFEAAKFFCEAGATGDDESRVRNLTSCRKLMDEVVQQHPTSEIAVQILLKETIGGVDIASVDSFLASKVMATESGNAASDPLRTNTVETPSSALGTSPEDVELGLHLDRAAIKEVQGRLLVSGHDPNGVDGVIGKGTRTAITSWQRGNGYSDNGFLTQSQIDVLRQMTVGKYDTWLETRRAEEKRRAANRQTRRSSGVWFRDNKGMYCRKMGNSGHYCQLWKPRALR